MSEISITRLEAGSANFAQSLDAVLAWDEAEDAAIHGRVMDIIARIRKEGDAAVIELTRLYDRFDVAKASDLELSRDELKKAWDGLPAESAEALQKAADRIRRYAEHQKMESWRYTESDGTVLGQQVTPLDKVGIYVPGGKAAYPSSVLMNAIPAKVAGVPEIIMVVPTPGGETNPLVLAAAYLSGIDRVFRIGGAQAVAALAYGTEMVPRVDKIVGPGNIYVATAKKLVFGQVGIDMVAGRRKFSSSATAGPTRTGSPWICFRRPSTTRMPRRYSSVPTALTWVRWKRAFAVYCRAWSAPR